MSQRELGIIRKARITLNDPATATNPRWSNIRLMELLDEGQKEFCRAAAMIVNRATINTAGGQEVYRLPTDCYKLLRASSEGKALAITSYDSIENNNIGWEDDTGTTYSHLIVNALSQQEVRPYPIVGTSKPIKIRYTALPIELGWDINSSDSLEELTISDMWDVGLRQYVVGMAFLDYGDASSISRSQVALGLYSGELDKADRLSKVSFAKKIPTTDYQAKVKGATYGSRNSRFGH